MRSFTLLFLLKTECVMGHSHFFDKTDPGFSVVTDAV